MKYCHHCGRLTPGEPLFCQSCGRTYDVKLCSRLHVNSRSAEVCSQCGSRDLSTPQPKVPLWTKGFELLLRGTVFILFVFLIFFPLLVLALPIPICPICPTSPYPDLDKGSFRQQRGR